MLQRRIRNIYVGQDVNYMNKYHRVVSIYPYIAYLQDINTQEIKCVCIGDLVIAGLESSLPVSDVAALI